MATEITKDGLHKTKMKKSRALTKIVPVSYFIPSHDFSQDPIYAELCEPLSFRDIEVAKLRSVGNMAGHACFHTVCPDLTESSCRNLFTRANKAQAFKDLVDYLKTLAFEHDYTGKMDNERLMQILEESVLGMKPGVQRFNCAYKLLAMRKREKKEKDQGGADHGNGGEDPWEASLDEFDEMVAREEFEEDDDAE